MLILRAIQNLPRLPLSRLLSSSRPLLSQAAFAVKPKIAAKPALKPVITHKSVGYWLLGNSALVFGIVVVGGLTRLTESGLSMVDWSLLGSRPPLNEEEWNDYFEKYKQFPEYKLLNKGMSVDEFKKIYWYEYSHRMLGRFIGVFYLIPAVYFIRKGYASRGTKVVMGLIGSLILCQGLLGWYMVKSGLDHKIVEENGVPRVSQYRLASHLTMAFTIYLISFAAGLAILRPYVGNLGNIKRLSQAAKKKFSSFKKTAHGVAGLTLCTAISGAFVAGLDAGLIYNTFPKMADNWIPSDLISKEIPLYKNWFENPTAVQFNHRILAISTYCSILALCIWSRRFPLPKRVKNAMYLVVGAASAQVLLGISTLLWFVPVSLASMHQAGSLVLLTSFTYFLSLLKRVY